MKYPLIRYAVASAIAAASVGVAHATDIATFNTSGRTNVVVYISGSTAVDNTLASIVQNSLCQADTLSTYISQVTFAGGGSETLYYCQAGTGSGLPTSDYLAVEKESTTGSVHGAEPLINVSEGAPSGVTFFDPTQGTAIDAANCTNDGSTTSNDCPTSVFISNVTPTGGVADVEAKLLRSVPGGAVLPAAAIGDDLVAAPGLDVVWGIAVTKNLYRALQQAEGLNTGTCATTPDVPQCVPSLSKEQVASILVYSDFGNTNLTFWNQVLDLPANPVDENIYLCRRDVGSGTEASFEAYFLGARCADATNGSDLHMATQDGQYVIESGSNGGIRTCLEAFYNHNNTIAITPYNSDLGTDFPPVTPTGDQWAIGILSSEETASNLTGSNDSWRLVAIDGVLPTLENVVNGFYPYFSTDAWYHYKSGLAYPSSAALGVFNTIQADVGSPSVLATADATYKNQPWGDGGDLSPASEYAKDATYTAFPVTQAEVEANPINLWSKAAGGSVNNCETPTLFNSGVSGAGEPSGNTVTEGLLLGSGNVNKQ